MVTPEPSKLDRIVPEARRAADARALTYREQALKIYRGSAAAARGSSGGPSCAN
jgi:hypothetical protein